MANLIEVLFACDCSDGQSSCTAWDIRTSTNLMAYKAGGNIQQRTLNILRLDYVVAANSTKPLIHVWPINKQEQIMSVRFVVPGRVNAMAVSPDGLFLVAAIQETLYIWHLSTGRMLNTISKHYQTINCIRFTDDSSHFLSAGQDGSVLVWNLTSVVGRGDDNQTPLYSFTDHGLPVKDVYVGGVGMRAYTYTVSLDRSCKVYDLSSGMLLLNVVFAEALHSVIANALETSVYVGTAEGNIYEFNIDSLPRTKDYHIEHDYTNKFVGHKAGTPVNCLALSVDGQTLISGGQDQQVCIWNIPSRQLIKTIPHKGALSNLSLHLTHPDIFNPEHKKPNIFINNLKRMIDPPEADEDQVFEVLVTEENAYRPEKETLGIGNASSFASTTVDNSEEIKELRAEIAHVKSVNNDLFRAACEYAICVSSKKL